MDIAIPNGRIIERPPTLVIESKLHRLHTAIALGTALETYDDVTHEDVELAEARLYYEIGGQRLDCTARLCDLNGPGLVIEIPLPTDGEYAQLYVQSGGRDRTWLIATKMLVVSKLDLTDAPRGREDEMLQRDRGRIALYVGLALMNNWF